MRNTYAEKKGRADGGSFFGLPKAVIGHENFRRLSSQGNKLLIDLGLQYRGYNNGDLCATWKFMKERGWKSRDTLNDALRELEYYGLIVPTQLGGLNKPSLYALSWRKIDKADESNKDFEWKVGDQPSTWKTVKPQFIKPSKKRDQKKTQARIAGQTAPNSVLVSDDLKAINSSQYRITC